MHHLGHLLAALCPTYLCSGHEPRLTSVVIDSRQVQPGALFVAFRGERVDGHAYVAQAFAGGALAAVVEQPVGDWPLIDARGDHLPTYFGQTPVLVLVESAAAALQQFARYWRSRFSTQVVGITGSVGKTSTKELTHHVLAQGYCTLKSERNYNTEIGLPLQVLNLRPEHDWAVLEMGMYVPGDVALLASIGRPQIGVVTTVGTVHVERAGSIAAIARGKCELVEALPASGLAILNRDDPRVYAMRDHTPARILTYGLTPAADLWADDIVTLGLDGVRFTLCHQESRIPAAIALPGRHSVYTALCATAVALAARLNWEAILTGLRTHHNTLRMKVRQGPAGSTLLDDSYNASPQSTLAALDLLAELPGRRVAVLGDMLELGSEEADGHAQVGRRAAQAADLLVAVGPRGALIAEAATAAGLQSVHAAATVDAALALVPLLLQSGDYVLIKASLGLGLSRLVAGLLQQQAMTSAS